MIYLGLVLLLLISTFKKYNNKDWERIDAFLEFANKNNLQMFVLGPIGPQSSIWAKTDSRTKEELVKNYEEFLTELCKKINGEENVRMLSMKPLTMKLCGLLKKQVPVIKTFGLKSEKMKMVFHCI